MKAERRTWWVTIAAAAAVLAAACGGGGGNDTGLPATTTAPAGATATTAPNGVTGTTAPAGVTATTAPNGGTGTTAPTGATVTTVARPDPVYVNDVPQVKARPTRAPAGTRVELEGYGFTGDPWQTADGYLWLSAAGGQGACYLMAQAEHDLHVTVDGHLSGSFVVPAKGACRFSTGDELDTGPLRYDIAFQCTACLIGTFTVILPGESMEEPTGTPCAGTVNFGVQDFAGEIYADGLTCGEATAFIEDHAKPLRPVTGPAHVEGGGFSCDRTGQSDAALPPRANYKCTGTGSRTIWFTRQ